MFKDLVKLNRSYRAYDESRAIAREELVELVDYARFAPSSVNVQPFKYYVAHEKDELLKIQPLTGWARDLPHLNLPYEGQCPTGFIIVCQDTEIESSIARYQKDVGIVAQTILLAAVEKDLGGCMIGNFSPAKVKNALDLAENITPVLIIAIGKPAEEITLLEAKVGEPVNYYRDENGAHYVPKRRLEDIIL